MKRSTGFGSRTWNLDVMIEGARSLPELLEAIQRLVDFMGMDMAGMAPDVRSYPIPDGRGGTGLTVMQPYVESLIHQPLTTSFAIIDSWPEHFTLTIKSCVQFSAEAVMQELRRIFGEESILDCSAWTLGRVARPRRARCGGGG